MNYLLPENLELFEAHKSTYDALLAESAALRQEELQLADAFSKLPKEVATPEAFELFMRDIHLAHDELNQRLVHLSQESVAHELDAAEQAQSQLYGEKDQLSHQLGKTQQELQQSRQRCEYLEGKLKRTQEEQHQREQQRQAAESKLAEMRRRLEPLLRDDCESWEGSQPTLDFLSKLNEWLKGDIKQLDGDLHSIDHDVEGLWRLKDEIAKCHCHISNQGNRVRDIIDKALNATWLTKGDIEECPKALEEIHSGVEELLKCLDMLQCNIEKLQSHKNKAHTNLRQSQEKYEPLRKRVAEGSPLRELLNYLNTI